MVLKSDESAVQETMVKLYALLEGFDISVYNEDKNGLKDIHKSLLKYYIREGVVKND